MLSQVAGIDVNDKLGFDGAGSLSSLFQIQGIKNHRRVLILPIDELQRNTVAAGIGEQLS